MNRIILLLAVLFSSSIQAQNENDKWYFGEYAAIDFSSGNPVNISGSPMLAADMTVSVSDNSGSLLFYSNGLNVWNSNHVLMPNGTGLMGSNNAGNSCVAVKKPGSNDIYYLFTVDFFAGPNGLRYSIIDMSLQGGFGDVTVKNQLILTPVTEKLAVVKHCNGQDYWIICHQWNSNSFNAYLLTSSGLNTTPVISSIGSTHTGGTLGTYNALGQLSFTEDGSKAAVAIYDLDLYEIFDFDNSTGVFSNNYTIINYPHAWGVKFSPNGNVLYTTQWNYSAVYQFDLLAGSVTAIRNSATLVGNATSPNPNYKAGYMELAPDGKIYVAKFESYFLGVINNPDQLGTACNFVDNGFALGTVRSMAGVPNRFVIHSLVPPSLTVSNLCSGDSTSFSLSLPQPADSIQWNFGDPASGNSNSGTLPGHVFSGPGSYTVQAIIYYPCSSDTLSQQVTINTMPVAVISGTDSICSGQAITLTASGGTSYQWSGGSNATTQSITDTPTTATTYYVIATNGTCTSAPDTFTVQVLQSPVANVSGVTSICSGQSTTLTASGGTSYQWSGGSSATTATITVSPTTTTVYYVTVSDGTCMSQPLATTVQVIPVPVASVSGNTNICAGQNTTLTASGGSSYQWNTGDTTQSITVNPSTTTTYYVTVSNGPCYSAPFTVTVNVAPFQGAAITGPTSVCAGTSATLNASGGGTYQWSTGATTSSITVNPPVTTTYSVVVTNTSGCTDTAYYTLNVNPPPFLNAGPDVTICAGDSIQLNGTFSGSTFYWTPNTNISSIWPLDPWVYPGVTTTYVMVGMSQNDCGGSDSVTVNVSPCTGIDEVTEELEIVITPNPADDYFEISSRSSLEGAVIELYNSVGQLVMFMNEEALVSKRIDVAQLSKGLYFVKISARSGVKSTHLIIE